MQSIQFSDSDAEIEDAIITFPKTLEGVYADLAD